MNLRSGDEVSAIARSSHSRFRGRGRDDRRRLSLEENESRTREAVSPPRAGSESQRKRRVAGG